MRDPLIKQLRELRTATVCPKKEWLQNNRALLMSQIKNTLPAVSSTQSKKINIWSLLSYFIPRSVVYNFLRPAAALVVALAIVSGSWIKAVDAAYEALPGDAVAYPVKRNIEKLQAGVVSLLGDNSDEMKLHMEFAKRRAAETKKIIEISKTDPDRINKVAGAVADLKNEINTVNKKLEQSSGQGDKALAAQDVTDVKQGTDQVKNTLQDVKNTLATSSSTQNQIISQEVSVAKDLAKDVSVAALQVIVTKHLDGEISKEVVQQAVNNTLQSAVAEVNAVQQNVGEVKSAVDAAKVGVKGLTDDTGKQADGSIGTSTARATAELNVVVEQTKEAALQTQVASDVVSQKSSEVQTLLSNGNLNQVINKLKEVNQVTKDAEKISDSTLQTVQTILPIVGVIKDNSLPAASSSIGILPTVSQSVVSTTFISTGTPAPIGTLKIPSTTVKTKK